MVRSGAAAGQDADGYPPLSGYERRMMPCGIVVVPRKVCLSSRMFWDEGRFYFSVSLMIRFIIFID